MTVADEEEVWVPGDRYRLQQVVGALVDNALVYTEPGLPIHGVPPRRRSTACCFAN